ncbi:GTPase HflX [Candidatus Uhrbacteria bacterium]|nr:GTPase HflX [Candidatus Uhrbacteria bacterium]
MERAILIDIIPPRMRVQDSRDRLDELESLVRTYGGVVVVKTHQRRATPHPRTFIGPGKIEMIAQEGKELKATMLIINNQLKPRQTYLIAEALRPAGIRVMDRVDLILHIFRKHAQTAEARLEIELAAVRHMGPRIFGMGAELSRQGGGIGTMGIGETNTERMKRHLKEQERQIQKELEKYEHVRANHQKGRRRRGLRTVAIVGYTNAGKTTLLNALTGRKEYAADKLFATLDTRVGSLYIPSTHETLLVSDTIGFIKDLPPTLINAFASTLSETVQADLLLQVVDAADPHLADHLRVVDEILEKIGASGIPRFVVFNKMDAAGKRVKAKLRRLIPTGAASVFVSAEKKEGMEGLVGEIERKVRREAK